MKPSTKIPTKFTLASVAMLSTHKVLHAILGEICVMRAVNIEVKVDGSHKRKEYVSSSYSSEFNLIEDFRHLMKFHAKRSKFAGGEGLTTRVANVSNRITALALLNMSQHSVNMFCKCL
ncbi:hypothetical protein PHYBLDRAFT_66006 [Phycomyces blakesleeanus NRRL 1555(-)]|uniref:Uncharacterized protein n=1 Tax=Phycomyces blakesleeanus (strain ATCC 8743b / DSM 1359 / FGSC 10004 / NBRC 33097 / NRRL 1555) TaxID=763407 RepID=A0A167MNU6_PHYB8|nr:hypothetical protein PHYBLDRAFT_66006 [Phycomyces blakesleeanus NRRL 1555(-)]OAD73396.1 hypothetical protein PHYBLDRAFT_66006 [Phycomyces blakesleeanus NRRL 1555(-)]|eukprot:XP_018291436.1 hypothetical protein PHYBLDRAFT_66006 [Phycomyces blakesleeanus NRRL 1555(-)]